VYHPTPNVLLLICRPMYKKRVDDTIVLLVTPEELQNYTHVGMVREPTSRFVSGFREIIERNTMAVNGLPKNGTMMLKNKHNALAWTAYERGETMRFWDGLYNASDYWLWKGTSLNSDGTYTIDHAERLYGFLEAVECAWENFPNWAHIASACYFMAQPHLMTHLPSRDAPEEAARIDVLIRQESYEEDIMKLMRKMGYSDQQLKESKCKLRHRNKGLEEHKGMQPSDFYLEEISKDADYQIRLCKMYIQDYICFDYPLPSECQELNQRAERIANERIA